MKTFRALAAFSLLTFAVPTFAARPGLYEWLDVSPSAVSHTSVAQGAMRVEMLRLVMQVSCAADVRVDSITLKHEGLGDASDIERVYIADERRRVSRAVSFSGNDQKATLRTTGLIIPRCTNKTFSAFVDFAPDAAAGGEHRIILSSGDGVQSNTTVGIRPTETITLTRTTPATTGTIDVEYLPIHGIVRYGANRVVSRLRLDADGGSDHVLNSITLTNDGSAQNTDLRNLWIEASGKPVTAKLSALDGDKATLVFDPPLALGRNESRVLQLRADVRASSKRTIRFILEEPSDLDAAIQRQRGARFQ